MHPIQNVRGPDALMAWAQRSTLGYEGVDVTNFTSSWRDGLAFAAWILSRIPLSTTTRRYLADDPLKNLTLAFDAADKLGVPPLIKYAEMFVGSEPDRFCISELIFRST